MLVIVVCKMWFVFEGAELVSRTVSRGGAEGM